MFESQLVSRTDLLNWLGIPKLDLGNEKASRMVGGFFESQSFTVPIQGKGLPEITNSRALAPSHLLLTSIR